jgi:hypothetical protein
MAPALFLLVATPVFADRWGKPGEQTYFSQNQGFRFTVLPRVLSSSSAYWLDKEEDPRKRGQAPGQRDTCVGQLERRSEDGSYVPVWRAWSWSTPWPVLALLTRDGRYVVTFDNWHAVGYGDDTVVLYGAKGEKLASFGLSDFLTQEQIAQLSVTVSSIWWGGKHRFDENETSLVLEIVKSPKPKDSRLEPEPWLIATLSLESPAAGFRVTPARPTRPRN